MLNRDSGLAFNELLAYTRGENARWHRWFAAHAALLELAHGEPPLDSVRHVIRHIAFVEHRYAAILTGRPPPGASSGGSEEVDELFAYLADGRRQFEQAVSVAGDRGLERMVEFVTLSAGARRTSTRKVIGHTLMHGIRHWAQLATVLRARGHATDWPHDLLLSDALT